MKSRSSHLEPQLRTTLFAVTQRATLKTQHQHLAWKNRHVEQWSNKRCSAWKYGSWWRTMYALHILCALQFLWPQAPRRGWRITRLITIFWNIPCIFYFNGSDLCHRQHINGGFPARALVCYEISDGKEVILHPCQAFSANWIIATFSRGDAASKAAWRAVDITTAIILLWFQINDGSFLCPCGKRHKILRRTKKSSWGSIPRLVGFINVINWTIANAFRSRLSNICVFSSVLSSYLIMPNISNSKFVVM